VSLLYDIHHANDGAYPVGIVIDERAIDRLEASCAADREHQRADAFSAYSIGSNRPVVFIELMAIFTLVSVVHGFAGSIATDDSDDILAENAELKFPAGQDIGDEEVGHDRAVIEDVEHLALGHAAIIRQYPPAIEMLHFLTQEFGRSVDVRLHDVVDAGQIAVVPRCRGHASVPHTRTTLPGFMMLCGSSAIFSWRITATASPCSAARKSILP